MYFYKQTKYPLRFLFLKTSNYVKIIKYLIYNDCRTYNILRLNRLIYIFYLVCLNIYQEDYLFNVFYVFFFF